MDRRIAVVTYGLTNVEQTQLDSALARYQNHMIAQGIDVAFEHIGTLEDISNRLGMPETDMPEINLDGSLNYDSLNVTSFALKTDGETYMNGASDLMLVVNRKITDSNPEHWHTQSRGGEAYGGGLYRVNIDRPGGEYFFIGINPLERIEDDRDQNLFLDYILRHEAGHILGGFEDLPEEAQDNIMRPLQSATPQNLRAKNLDYTPEQVATMKRNVTYINCDTVAAFRKARDSEEATVLSIGLDDL
jgi:hypothetical protein